MLAALKSMLSWDCTFRVGKTCKSCRNDSVFSSATKVTVFFNSNTLDAKRLKGAGAQENLAAVANAASMCFFGFFSRKSSIIQKVLVRLI